MITCTMYNNGIAGRARARALQLITEPAAQHAPCTRTCTWQHGPGRTHTENKLRFGDCSGCRECVIHVKLDTKQNHSDCYPLRIHNTAGCHLPP